MSARATAPAGIRSKRRWTTFAWIAGTSAVIIALLYTEQIALLYVLATLAVTALLIIVALANLSGARVPYAEPRPADDSAAIGDNLITPAAPAIAESAGNLPSNRRARNAKRR